MIRPETIGIVQVGNAPLSGVIDSISFIGDRQRMVLSGVSNRLLTVDAPNTIKTQIGERVGLLVASNAVRLLPLEK
jgi:putative spermidine/putrescine transport system ATP-binding protein